MLSTLQMRNQTIKFSQLSELKPDYYFIQGYIKSLGANPDTVKASQWMGNLFGKVNFDSAEVNGYLPALMQLHNELMEKIMQEENKLPVKCVLSKSNLKGSLASDAPLPNWCLGMLKGLKLIDKQALSDEQLDHLHAAQKLLTTFTSFKNVSALIALDGYEAEAQRLKRYLSTDIHNLIYVMRFELQEDSDEGHEEDNSEFEQMMDYVMNEDDKSVLPLIEAMIEHFESVFDAAYLKENQGHVWHDTEVRPYMAIRARRAQLNFKRGNKAQAIEELQTLLALNTNDNQANRYSLANFLVIEKRWDELANLIAQFDEQSVFMLASNTLMLFALEGDSSDAKKAKKLLKKANKHLEKYLTGQSKSPKNMPERYSPGDKAEALIYLSLGAKETWHSVEGSLFWLRRK